jgi:cytochrome d ubiquinol oxidase subunit I
MLVLGVSAWHLLRRSDDPVWSRSARQALPLVLVAVLGTAVAGHFQGMLLEEQQPMKMAAAEAQFETEAPAAFSLFATGDLEHNPGHTNVNVRIPHLLSLLATGSWNGEVKGINDIQKEEEAKYGPGDYTPIIAVTYWTFRLMVGAGMVMIALSAIGLWLARRRRLERTRWFLRLAVPAILLPHLANITGWIFTEMGRQPWVVYGLLRTDEASSPTVGTAALVITLVGYTVIYGVLAAVGGWIALREIRHGAPPAPQPADRGSDGPEPPPTHDRPDLALTY